MSPSSCPDLGSSKANRRSVWAEDTIKDKSLVSFSLPIVWIGTALLSILIPRLSVLTLLISFRLPRIWTMLLGRYLRTRILVPRLALLLVHVLRVAILVLVWRQLCLRTILWLLALP